VRRVLVLVLTVAACRQGPREGAPCSAVATRRLVVAQADLGSATVDPATRALALRQFPALREALARACQEGSWSPAIRECMVQAPDHAAFQECVMRLTDDQRRAFDLAVRGETPSP
jgi:hypothetical protein